MGTIYKSGIPYSGGGGGGDYTAGNGIDITGNEISVDDTVVATKADLDGKQDTLTAGDGINIANDTISGTKIDASKGTTSSAEVVDTNGSKLGVEFGEDVVLSASSPMLFGESVALQKKLVSGTDIKTVNNESLLGGGNIDIQGSGDSVFIATYNVTPYAELKAARDSNKAIYFYDGVALRAVGFSTEVSGVISLYLYLKMSSPSFEQKWYTCTEDNVWAMSWEHYLPSNTINSQHPVAGTAIKSYVDGKAGVNFEVGAEKWYGTYKEDGITYQVYSKVLKIAALPAAAGITNYPHGITGIKQILCAYGFGTNGFVLNAPRQNAQDNIAIYQVQKASGGSVAIEVGKDRSNMGAYVCLVYAKDN